MSKQSDRVKHWRKSQKQRIIDAMGGCCCICGYNKCNSSLALHHLDPTQKEFNFGRFRANPKNWETTVKELRKCVLLCHNCHCEVHYGIATIPENYPRFAEKFSNYKELYTKQMVDLCPVCGTEKPKCQKTCSNSCSSKRRYRINWDSIDLKTELDNKTYLEIAEKLGCSDGAVYKRAKRLGLKNRKI